MSRKPKPWETMTIQEVRALSREIAVRRDERFPDGSIAMLRGPYCGYPAGERCLMHSALLCGKYVVKRVAFESGGSCELGLALEELLAPLCERVDGDVAAIAREMGARKFWRSRHSRPAE